jgi:hypothetical protein
VYTKIIGDGATQKTVIFIIAGVKSQKTHEKLAIGKKLLLPVNISVADKHSQVKQY